MRVAVVVSNTSPSAGGAFTFEESLKAALLELAPENLEFVFYPLDLPSETPTARPWTRAAGWTARAWSWGLKRLGLVSRREFEAWRASLEAESLRGSGGWNTDNPLNRAIVADGCHLAYFLTPGMVPVEVPFLATHWDLGHRRWPVFPDVSLSGWTWGQREWYYTHWLQRAALIQTGTQTGKEELKTAYGIQDANIVVNPFPVPGWLATTVPEVPRGFDGARPFLYYPAQFWPHKNHIVLLEVLRILKDEGTEVDLVLTGSDKGNLGFVQDKVREYGLESQVRFPGFVSRGELLWLYRNTALMVFPCFLGPDNLPPLEALAAGSRVAVADIPGARDYLPSGAVSYFDPKDEVALAALVRRHLGPNPGPRAQYGEALPTAEAYAARAVTFLRGLGDYRRCWGFGYRHP